MSQSGKIKILFVVTQGEMGGAQRYVFDLATNLDPQQYESLVATGREKTDLKNHLEKKNIPVKLARHLKRNLYPIHDLLAVWELKKIIEEFAPDIIHLNSSKAGVVGTLAAILAGNENVVFTAHGFAFLEPNNFLVNFIYFWAEKLASAFRKKIIAVSEYDRREAIKIKLCAPEKLITIHNGISSSVIATLSETEGEAISGIATSPPAPRNDNEIIIGTIAHDYPTKDLKTLRKAVDLVKKDYPNAELKIISGIPNAVAQLSGFNIYVCSSIKEGFPYTILEAMAAGLPIVSTNVGGIPEMLSDLSLNPSPSPGEGNASPQEMGRDGREVEIKANGILVPPKNPRALAAAIKKLIADQPLAKKLGENAREKIKSFSLQEMMEKTKAVYREVIAPSGALSHF